MPVGLLWLGLLAAGIWAYRRRQRGLGHLLAGLWLVLTLAGNDLVGSRLVGLLERKVPNYDEVQPLDVLFVLGGGTQVDAQDRPHLSEAGDRLMEAARLWHRGRVKLLVASGMAGDRLKPRNLAQESRALWMDLGVPEAAILEIEAPCWITRDEIQAYTRLKAHRGWARVGLLSSAWHLPRAMALAKRAGLEALPVPSDFRGRVPRFQLWNVVPSAGGLQRTQLAAWEVLGRAMGR